VRICRDVDRPSKLVGKIEGFQQWEYVASLRPRMSRGKAVVKSAMVKREGAME